MNKVFRVIWNTATQTWVAVSELARGRVKSSSSNAINLSSLALTAALGLATFIPTSVEAARTIQSLGTHKVHIETEGGTEATPTANKHNILIGPTASVKQTTLAPHGTVDSMYHEDYTSHNIVIGNHATSAGWYNIVLGHGAKTYGNQHGVSKEQIAIGTSAFAAGQASVAIGKDAYTSSLDSIALGTGARALGGRGISLGQSSRSVADSIALGSNANATFAHSVALGHSSVTNQKATQEGNIVVSDVNYGNAAGAVETANEQSSYVVSVGSDTIKRQIKNVAPGKISVDSTDAINGSQLFQITSGLQSRPITFEGNTGDIERNLGQRLEIKGSGTGNDFSAANVKTVANGNKVEIQFAQSPSFTNLTATGIITATGGLTVGGNQNVDMGNNRVAGVRAGEQATDAVNKGQLDAISNLKFAADNTGSGTIALQTGTLGIKGTSNYVQTNRNGSDVTINLADQIRTKLDNLAANPNETYANKNLANIDTAGVNKVKQHAKEAVEVTGDNQFTTVSKATNTGKDVYTVSVNEQVVKTTAQNAINVAGNGDVTVSPSTKPQNGVKTFTLGLDKASSITAESEKVATSKAVYNAIAGARTQVTSNDSSVNIQQTDANGLGANIYNLSVNTAKVIESLGNTFAKADASNITQQAGNWRENLSVYSKTETTTEINKAKETVEAGHGIAVASSGSTSGGTQFTVSVNNDYIKQQAKEAIKLIDGTNTTVQESTDNSNGEKTYAVNVNLAGLANTNLSNLSSAGTTEIKKVAKDAIAATGNSDISVSTTPNNTNGAKNFTFSLNKAAAITDNDERAATSKAVHSAIVGAKTTISSTDQSVNITPNHATGLNANTYDISINTTKVIADLDSTFARTNASNISGQATAWRNALEVYSRTETDSKIEKVKEAVESGTGISIEQEETTAGKKFTVSVDNTHLKQQAQQAVKLANGTNTIVQENDSDGNKTYTVNVNLDDRVTTSLSNLADAGKTEVKKLAKEAIVATGNNDVTVVTGGADDTATPKTFTFGLNKADAITATDEKAATAKAVHSAIVGAKTQVSSSDSYISVQNTEHSNLSPNSYSLSLNLAKLTQDLSNTFVQTSNLGVTPFTYKVNGTGAKTTTLSQGLDFVNTGNLTIEARENGVVAIGLDSTTREDITKRETVVGSNGVTVTSENSNETGGKEFSVSLDNNYIDGRAKAAVTVANGDNTTVTTTNNENGATTYAVNVDLSNVAQTDLSNLKTEGQNQVKTLAKQAIDVTNADNFTSVEKDTQNGKDTYKISVSQDAVKSAAHRAIEVSAGADIDVEATTSDGVKTFALTLNKANSIVQDDTNVATSQAVHSAITGAKTTVNATGDIVTVTKEEKAGIEANNYTISVNTNNLKTSLNDTFAKVDATNLGENASVWRTALDVYNKEETRNEIDNAKETVKGSAGINVDAKNVTGKGQEFTVSLDNNHIKAQAKSAVEVTGDNHFANVSKDTSNTDKDIYIVSVSEQAVKAAAHSAIAATGSDDVNVVASTNDTQNQKTFTVSLNKADSITADDEKVATTKAVHSAIANAKTTVNATDELVTIQANAQDGIGANSYGISLNTNKLAENLTNTFAKSDATNIGTTQATAWRTALDVYNKAQTNTEIAKAKETVKAGTGITVTPKEVADKGQEFTVAVDDSHIKTQAKQAIKVVHGNNTSVTEGTEGDAKTFRVDVDLSNYATNSTLSNTQIGYKANGGEAKSVLLSQGLNFTNTGNLAITAKDNGVIELGLDDETKTKLDVRETVVQGTGIVVNGDTNNDTGGKQFTVSVDNNHIKAQAKDAVKVAAQDNDAFVSVTLDDSTGSSVYKVGVDQQAVTSAAKNAIQVIGNTDIAVETDNDAAKTFALTLNKATEVVEGENKALTADAAYKAITSAKTKVAAGDNLVTVTPTESDNLTRNQYTVALDTTALKTHLSTSLNDTFATVKASNVGQYANLWRTALDVYSKAETNNAINLAKETVVNGTGVTVSTSTNRLGAQEFTVALDNSHIQAQAKQAISVTGDADILVNASEKEGKQDFAISLTKATAVEANNASALTSGAAYIAITEAKTKVTSKDDLLTLTKTAESDDLTANEYDVALNRTTLKTHLTTALNDTFAKTDASNITPKTWRDTLNVYDKTETDSAINAISTLRFMGDNGSSSIALQTDTLGFKGQTGYLETRGNGSDITIQLADGVKNKLDNLAENPNATYTNQSLDNLNTQGIAKIKEQVGIENGLNTTATSEEKNGVKTFKVDVDLSEYSKTADLGSTALSYKANSGEGKTTSLTNGLDFQNKGNLTIATQDNGVVELSLDAQTVKDIAVRETVVAGTGITVTDTETNNTDGKQFRVAVDNSHIKAQAKEAVQVAAANNDEFVVVTPNVDTNNGNTTYQVAVSKQAVQAAAKDVVDVTGNNDILVNTTNNTTDKSFALSLDKANAVIKNEEKVITAGAVYSAVTGAKSKVTTGDNLITLTSTEFDDLKANQYHLALNTANLKTHLTENLNDTFAKLDASNVAPQAQIWRSALEVYNKAETNSAINNAGWTLKANTENGTRINNHGVVTFKNGNNIDITLNGNDITVNAVSNPVFVGTVTAGGLTVSPNSAINMGNNRIQNVADAENHHDAVNLSQLNTLGNNTLTVSGNTGETNAQTLNYTGGLHFTVQGDGAITSQASGSTVTLDLTAETKADIAKREKVTAGEGILVSKTTNNTGGTTFNVAVDNAHIKNQLEVTGSGLATVSKEDQNGKDIYTVNVDQQAVTSLAKNAISVTGNDDIKVSETEKGNKQDFALTLDKAEHVAENDTKVVTAGAVYQAITRAKTQLDSRDDLIRLHKTESENLDANRYTVSLDRVQLKNHLTHELNDTFAKQDASNVEASVWRTVLDVLSRSEISSAINASGWILKVNQEVEGEKITNDGIVTFNQDQNIEIKREGNHINIKTVEAPTFSRVSAGTLTTTGSAAVGGMLHANGGFTVGERQTINLGNNVVSGVATGVEETDATNVKQVKDLVANSAWKLSSGSTQEGIDETLDTLAEEDINPNDKLTLQAGKNLKVKREANGIVTYATQDNVSFTNVNTGSLNVAGATTLNQLTVNGESVFNRGFSVANGQTVDMGGNRVQNIGDAKEHGDAVNLKQLQEMSSNLTQSGLNFSGNQGETERNLGQTIAIEGKATTEGSYSSANIKTVVENGKVEIQIAERPKFDNVEVSQLQAVGLATKNANISDNLTVSGNTTLGGQGKNLTVKEGTAVHMGGNVVSGIANGDISPNSSDAVNGSQLYAIQQLVGQGDSKDSTTTIINSDGTAQDVQISQSNGYTLTTYNVESQKEYRTNNVIEAIGRMNEQGIKFFHTNDGMVKPDVQGGNTVDSSASGKYATAVGFQAKASGENAVSFGKGSQALGKDTISIGTGNIVSGNNSGAFGDPSIVSGNNSYTIGNDNTVATNNSFVVGNNVTNTVDNSVFLGADTGYVTDGKTTKGNAAYTSQVIDGQTYQYAGGKVEEVVGVVSVGNIQPNGTMQTRRIQNVAPGLISENSTDAVNGSQLYSLTHFVNQGWELNTGVVDGTNGIVESAAPTKIGLGNSVKVNAGQNIVLTQHGNAIDIATSMTPTFNSLKLNQGSVVDMGGIAFKMWVWRLNLLMP
ncbi:hypothetical protein A1D29_08765 [Pasteurellaceae bacterium Orientalotternb1]|nr:hypothetical protein A1D29_08765 [Pasteurellaceae bacterium Orientalotternb1]